MPIRFTLVDGRPEKIETDTIDEAVRFYHGITNGTQSNAKKTPDEKRVPERVRRTATDHPVRSDNGLRDETRRLIDQLLEHENGITSQALSEALGIHAKALGTRVTNLMHWARSVGLSKKDLISKDRRRDEKGDWVRTWRLTPGFRKRLKDGEFDLVDGGIGSGRKGQLVEFLKAHGPMSRKDILQQAKIPEGTIGSLLGDKTAFRQLEDKRWDIVGR